MPELHHESAQQATHSVTAKQADMCLMQRILKAETSFTVTLSDESARSQRARPPSNKKPKRNKIITLKPERRQHERDSTIR